MSERLSRPGAAQAVYRPGYRAARPVTEATTLSHQQRVSAIVAALLGLLVLLAFFVWEGRHLSGVTYSHWGALGKDAGNDYDEGAYVVSAQLLLHGYSLFSAVFSAQPAFFLPSLAAVLRVVSDPVAGGHLYAALSGGGVLLGLFWMAWSAYRPLAAPLAVAVAAATPGFLLYAHAVEAEIPMLGLCTLAVAAAQSYYLTQRRALAALCGLFLMAATEMKLLSVVVAVPLVLLLGGGAWRGYRAGRRLPALLGDAAALVLCIALPALVTLALLAPSAQLHQVVTFHLDASKVLTLHLDQNVAALRTFLGYDPGLLLAALAGAAVAVLTLERRVQYLVAVYALWFVTTLAFLWRYHPLLQHQFVPLLPPLALLAAGLAGPDWSAALHAAASGLRRRLLALPIAAVGVVAYLALFVTVALPLDRHLLVPSLMPHRSTLVAWLDAHTRPGDFVACDDPMIALFAHRFLAPGLEDPSIVRTSARYLTDSEAIAATQRYHVAAIVAVRPLLSGTVFTTLLPGYMAWVRAHYRLVQPPLVPGVQLYQAR